MTKLPKFFFAESPESPGAGFVIATDIPSYLLKVFKFNNNEDLARFENNAEHAITIPDYRICLQHFGTLSANRELDPDDLEVCLRQAAAFYFEYKIKPNEKYHKRFLI